MRITVLARGGLAVYGGHYDPHANEAVALVREDDTVAVTIEYPTAPTSPAKTARGLTCATPAISGKTLTCTLSAINDGGYVDITATVGAATRKIRIRARNNNQIDDYASGSELL